MTDPAGAVVAHASITAVNKDTGVKFVTTSQADGDYIFQQLPVGTYTISVTAPGFKASRPRGSCSPSTRNMLKQSSFPSALPLRLSRSKPTASR